ncbi:MAG TPA: substrate-binding domain-containing protein [Candidatus Dormibacteraeota bacterium]|nr:substrate-binding domain-containing protein [Candidatus Dormibacteraeota bacterium]
MANGGDVMMPRRSKIGRTWRLLAAVFALTLPLLACGGGSAPSTSKKIPDYGSLFRQQVQPPPGDKAAQLQYYKSWARKAQQPATFDSFAGKPDVAIARNKRIMIIICTASGQGCVLQGEGGKQAAQAVGWTYTEVDGQGSAQVESNAIEQAIAQHYDGVYMAVVDRNTVATALADAHRAGIPVVTSISGNTAGGDLFASVDAPDFYVGRTDAAWAIAQENGKPVRAAVIYLSLAGVNLFRAQGFVAQINACGWCSLVEAPLSYTIQTINQLPSRVSSLIQAHPDINYIFMDVGPWVTYVVQGMSTVRSLASNMTILSTDCVPDQLSRMAARKPFREICDAYASVQAGWGAVDELSRAMQGKPPGGDKVATQLFTSDNMNQIKHPFTIGYDVDNLDYRAAYRKAWGLG